MGHEKLYNVKMTEKEVQLFCDIIAVILDRDENDFCGNVSIGYSESDNDTNDTNDINNGYNNVNNIDDVKDINKNNESSEIKNIEETEETLELALKYVEKQLLPIPTENS